MQRPTFLSHIPEDRIRVFDSVAQWEADRQSRRSAGAGEIGGSLVAQILGLRPFGKTPWQAYLTLTGQQPPREEGEQEILNEGILWEPRVVEDYNRVSKASAVMPLGRPTVVQIVGKEPWVVVTPDAFVSTKWVWDDSGDTRPIWGGLEVKTDRDSSGWAKEPQIIEKWDDAAGLLVPPMYGCQVYLYLYATELPYWDIAAMIPRSWGFPELRWHRFMAHPPTQDLLVNTLGEWREKHIVQGVPPDIDDSAECAGFLARKHPARTDGRKPLRVATELEEATIHEWVYAQRRHDEAQVEERRLKNEVLSAIGADYGVRVRHGKVIAFTNPGRRTFDADRLQKEFPEAYAATVREGESFKVVRSYVK